MNELLPRLIRFKDAPMYLGMDRNRFNKVVRPYLTQIPIGTQGIAFDRFDLDAWVDNYKSQNGRPTVISSGGKKLWDVKEPQLSLKEVKSGTSKNDFSEAAFEKALAQSYSAKPKAISREESKK